MKEEEGSRWTTADRGTWRGRWEVGGGERERERGVGRRERERGGGRRDEGEGRRKEGGGNDSKQVVYTYIVEGLSTGCVVEG